MWCKLVFVLQIYSLWSINICCWSCWWIFFQTSILWASEISSMGLDCMSTLTLQRYNNFVIGSRQVSSNFFTCGPFSLCVPFYSGGITDNKGGSQSQSSQSNLVEKFLHNAQVVSIGEINSLKQVTNWTVQSFMCVLPHLCFYTYCLPFFRIVTVWLLGQLTKSSLMLHGVMTIVLIVPQHLIHPK